MNSIKPHNKTKNQKPKTKKPKQKSKKIFNHFKLNRPNIKFIQFYPQNIIFLLLIKDAKSVFQSSSLLVFTDLSNLIFNSY